MILGSILTYFTARSNLVPYAFVWEKGKTMDFSETVVVYDIKVGRCSQLNEYLNLYEYQRSRSFIDIGPSSLRFNIFKLLLLWNCKADWSKFHVEPPWNGGMKEFKWFVTSPRWWPCAYMVKTFKIFFSDIKRPTTLKLGMWHWLLEYYQICSNDDPGLTLTYFTARSNLVPFVFVWENA